MLVGASAAASLLCVATVSCAPEESPLTISASSVGLEGEILRRQLARFERESGIAVRIQQTPDDASQRHQLYVQWLNARIGSPDVLQLDVVWTPELAAAGWIASLDGRPVDAEDLFPASIHANSWNGRLYAVPWFLDAGMLYRRTDLVPDAPERLEDLHAAAARLTQSDEVRHGIVWQGARYEGLITVFVEILTAFGGTILDDRGRPALDSPQALAALEFLRAQIERGIAPREVLTWHEEEVRLAFQNGESAFMRNWPYAVALLSDSDESHVSGRFAVSAIPPAPGGRAAAALGGGQLAINRWTEKPDDAWRLIAFLTAPEQMLERALRTAQYPARKSLYDTPALDEALGTSSAEVRSILEAAVPRPVTPVWSEMSELIQIEIHRALAGQINPAEALRRANRGIEALLARSGLEEGVAR